MPQAKLVALCSIALFLTACSSSPKEPVAGFVQAPAVGVRVGARAPEATFLDRAGKLRSLSALYEDATLIVFTPEMCSEKSPAVEAAAGAAGSGVALVRISTCDGKCCKDHEQCVQTMADGARHIVTLCDGKAVLRKCYGVATSSVVFLLDRHGVVVAEGTLDDLPALAVRARKMVQDLKAYREALYSG